MKANEMPKRIYLFDCNDAMVTPLEGDTTYVREDTFIEKACEWLKENADVYEAFDSESKSYYMDKDKLVGDFKEYMKGEKVMIGVKAGMKVRFRGDNYLAVAEKSTGSCEGCCWQDARGCAVPAAVHLFDRCQANKVVYVKVND